MKVMKFYSNSQKTLEQLPKECLSSKVHFEEKDIIKNPAFRWEMEQKSGQPLSPCVVVNGQMLADISGDEVETYLLANQLAGVTAATTSVPTDRGCSDEEHAAMAAGLPIETGARVKFIE